jgi:hypothetical protein
MEMERTTNGGMLKKCQGADAYTGAAPPTCDEGDGCVECWAKHHAFLDANRPPMSADFKEFFDYICMQKRLIQVGRFKSDELPLEGSLYDHLSRLEAMIRTGSFRHVLPVLTHTLNRIGKP